MAAVAWGILVRMHGCVRSARPRGRRREPPTLCAATESWNARNGIDSTSAGAESGMWSKGAARPLSRGLRLYAESQRHVPLVPTAERGTGGGRSLCGPASPSHLPRRIRSFPSNTLLVLLQPGKPGTTRAAPRRARRSFARGRWPSASMGGGPRCTGYGRLRQRALARGLCWGAVMCGGGGEGV